ncbi:MAG: metallophosphoesterase family protein [Oscillospiraceae bacterium]|nr:metallophosphoesterase family protein [Oscillospiraceae bacterium]
MQSNKKNKLVFWLLSLILLLSVLCNVSAVAQTIGASAVPDHITLTWTQSPLTTQTITWRTDLTVKNGIVQYAKYSDKASFPCNALSVKETATEFDTNTGNFYIHSATLTCLASGTAYVYRVGDGVNWSDVHTFSTEANNTNKFSFLIFGDSQSGDQANPNYAPWQTTIQNAYKANPDAKFFVNVGDPVEIGQDYNHWENWFPAAKGVIDTIPDMPAQGNHETYLPGGYSTSVKPIYWEAQFKLPANGAEGLLGQTYSYDYGNVHIVVLDSQEAEEAPINGDILAAQETWLDNDLKNTDKTWKIVFFHKTPYYNKATRTNEDIKAAFCPIFDKYHVDIVFNGHDHDVSRTYPINNDTFVSSISQGTVYYTVGRSGNKSYPDLSSKIWDAFFYDPQDQPNYITASVDGNTLTINAFKQDGTPIDHYVMDKCANTKAAIPTFSNTRMVIYGNMLQQPYVLVDPQQIDGKWYVSAQAFVQYIGGSASISNDQITLVRGTTTVLTAVNSTCATINGVNTPLPDKVLMNGSNYTVSADDLKAMFGFSWRYDSTSNLLYFTK